MQSNTPKGEGQRERPLQKSMFLPEFQPQPLMQSRPQPLENIHYNPMKRSSMPVLESMHQNNLSPTYHSHNISYTQPYVQPPPIPLQFTQMRAQSQHQLLLPQNNNIGSVKSLNVIRTDPPADLQARGFSKFDKSLGFQARSVQYSSNEGLEGQQQLINAIMEQLKEKHLPNLMKAIKKELAEQISSLRNELSGLKVQMKVQAEKQEFFNNEIRSQTGNIINFNTNNINNINKIKKEEGEYIQLTKTVAALERKYSQIEVKVSQNLTSLYNEFEKITQRLDKESKQRGFKVSQVKSSLTPIMLQYKESFFIKRSELVPRSSGEEEIVIGTCCYYIDRNGYLLDGENKYLTDLRGHQIRLQEKHLKLLEQYKLLHR